MKLLDTSWKLERLVECGERGKVIPHTLPNNSKLVLLRSIAIIARTREHALVANCIIIIQPIFTNTHTRIKAFQLRFPHLFESFYKSMWGNLAGTINKNSGGLLDKIGDVVAPVLDDVVEYTDSEEEEDYDDGEYYADEDEYDEDEYVTYDNNGHQRSTDEVLKGGIEMEENEVNSRDDSKPHSSNVDAFVHGEVYREEEVGHRDDDILQESEKEVAGLTEFENEIEKSHAESDDALPGVSHMMELQVDAQVDDENEIVDSINIKDERLSEENSERRHEFAKDSLIGDDIACRDNKDGISKITCKSPTQSESNACMTPSNDFDHTPESKMEHTVLETKETDGKGKDRTVDVEFEEKSLPKHMNEKEVGELVKEFDTSNQPIQNIEPLQNIDCDDNDNNSSQGNTRISNVKVNAIKCEDIDEDSSEINDDKNSSRHVWDEKMKELTQLYEMKMLEQQARFEEERAELRRLAQMLSDECHNVKQQARIDLENCCNTKDGEILETTKMLEAERDRSSKLEIEMENLINAENALVSNNEEAERFLREEFESKLTKAKKQTEDKVQEIQRLRVSTGDMRSIISLATTENHKMEGEIKSLKKEVERLSHELESTTSNLRELENENHDMGGLRMELRLLKESNERELANSIANEETTASLLEKTTMERDGAIQEAKDLERKLMQALADHEIAQQDNERVSKSLENMERALEAFQAEREEECALLEEHRVESESALKEAHEASLEALRISNDMRMGEVQEAANKAVTKCMGEIDELEAKLSEAREETRSTRKALDEAIRKLQATQDDVIDRTLMKNILLDWIGRKKDKDAVLNIMTSLLKFSEKEKNEVGLFEYNRTGIAGRVVDAVAAPLPPTKLHIDKIEGDSVQEKWVNFLISESSMDED